MMKLSDISEPVDLVQLICDHRRLASENDILRRSLTSIVQALRSSGINLEELLTHE